MRKRGLKKSGCFLALLRLHDDIQGDVSYNGAE